MAGHHRSQGRERLEGACTEDKGSRTWVEARSPGSVGGGEHGPLAVRTAHELAGQGLPAHRVCFPCEPL